MNKNSHFLYIFWYFSFFEIIFYAHTTDRRLNTVLGKKLHRKRSKKGVIMILYNQKGDFTMNKIISHCTVTCVENQSKKETRYMLLELTEEQGTKTYALWILNRENHAMEGIGDDLVLAKTLFEQAAEGELSPLHLYDWLSDLRKVWEQVHKMSILG